MRCSSRSQGRIVCFALGQLVRNFIDLRPENERVAIIASGSFSLEVGGPRMGLVNKDWHRFVVDCLQCGAAEKLFIARPQRICGPPAIRVESCCCGLPS